MLDAARPLFLVLTLLPALAGCEILGTADGLLKDTDTASENEETGEETEELLHWPSKEGSDDPGLPGWMGRTLIATTEGCWSDNDGVDPATAGCHVLYSSGDACDTCDEDIGERIGEACHTFTRTLEGGETEERTLLIETNPDADDCHKHAGGRGHPDVFDCDAYCKGSTNSDGIPYTSGTCQAIDDDTCLGGAQPSAYCACS